MAKKPGQDAKTIRPLWIVANLLLTLAICFLLLVIRNQLADFHKEDSSTTAPAVEDRAAGTARTVDHEVTRKPPATTRPKAGIQPTTQARQPPSDAGETDSQLPPAPPESISPPVPGGVIAAVVASASTNFITAIAGRVTLRGEAPPEAPIDMSASPPCAKLQTNSPTTRNFVVSPDGGLPDVFVSIVSGLDRKRYAIPQTNHELVFVNCQIEPYVSALMAGQRVLFRSADHITHNVHLMTTNNPEVNLALMDGSASRAVRLPSPEDFLRLKCDVHPWEFAYLSVVEHPFFAVTDTNGSFVIPNVPPGKYTLRALHRKAQSTNEITRAVTVTSAKISLVNFTLDAPAN